LNSDSILILTGPNNAGKSSVLKEIRRELDRKDRRSSAVGPVLKDMTTKLKGTANDLSDFVKERFDYDEVDKRVKLSYHNYLLKTLLSQFRRGKLPAPLEAEFVTYLSTQNRLGGDSRDRVEIAASLLQDDEPNEILISQIFRRAFGRDLILN